MLCEHLKGLSDYVKDNHIEIGSLDLINVVRTKCQITTECPFIPIENYQKPSQNEPDNKNDTEGSEPE